MVVPLLKEAGGPRMAYRITFGVRHLEDDWKRQLNVLIAKRQGDLDAVLLDFGVPLLDEQSNLITRAEAMSGQRSGPAGISHSFASGFRDRARTGAARSGRAPRRRAEGTAGAR